MSEGSRRAPGLRRHATGKAAHLALVSLIAAAALATGVFMALERTRPDAPDATAVSALTLARFSDLQGREQAIRAWQGKIRIVNFWATWCPPCRQEIPGLIAIQQRHAANGVEVIGIAIDRADKVRTYAAEMKIAYPILIAGFDALEIARQLGNKSGALPFTVVLDRNGGLVKTHLGLLTEAELEALLAPLLG